MDSIVDDWVFHPTLVSPFYLHLMGGGIVTTTHAAERRAVLAKFRARANEVTDQQLREMLASSWRPSLVAGWFIAYLRRDQFRTDVEAMLFVRPDHASHLCICIARLGGASAVPTLIAYLDGCATGTVQRMENDEAISPDWALCALEYLDPVQGADTGLSLWNGFIDRERQLLQDSRYGRGPVGEQRVAGFISQWEQRRVRSRQAFADIIALFDNGLQPSH